MREGVKLDFIFLTIIRQRVFTLSLKIKGLDLVCTADGFWADEERI